MMLTLRVALFLVIVVSLKIGQQRFGILSRYGIKGDYVFFFLIGLYLVLLVSEIAGRTRRRMAIRSVRMGAFFLSFPIGGVFGVIATYTGNASAVTVDAMAINFVGLGVVLGVIGVLLSGPISKMVTRVLRRNDIEARSS